MSLTSLDFQQARIKQVLFKSRLRSVLYGVREADPTMFSVHENPLGQWFETVVRPQYGRTAATTELERAIQRMLEAGQALVTQYRRGHIEEARTGLDQVDVHAARIEQLLQELERGPIAA